MFVFFGSKRGGGDLEGLIVHPNLCVCVWGGGYVCVRHVCMYVCMYVRMYMCKYVCMCVYRNVCMYIGMYVLAQC